MVTQNSLFSLKSGMGMSLGLVKEMRNGVVMSFLEEILKESTIQHVAFGPLW